MAETAVRALPDHVRAFVEKLHGNPAVAAVRLGGSRGARDWDLLTYLHPGFDWDAVTAALPSGTTACRFPVTLPTAVGEATLAHPLGVVDCAFVELDRLRWSAQNSRRGCFTLLPMTRSLEGMPSYVLEAEAALSDPLTGPDLATPEPPPALVAAADSWWSGRAALSLLIAEDAIRAGDPLSAQAHCTSALWSAAHQRALRDGWYLPGKRFLAGRADERSRTLAAGIAGAGPDAGDRVAELREHLGLSTEHGLAWARAATELGPGDTDD